jgi:hypothetical protein
MFKIRFGRRSVGNFNGSFYGPLDQFNFHRSIFVREIDEVSRVKLKELEVISGLNSIRFVETTDRFEFEDDSAVHDNVGSDVTDILTFVKDGNNTLRLVVHASFTKSNFKGTVIHSLTVPWS